MNNSKPENFRFIRSFVSMIRITWDTQPGLVIVLVITRITQGLFPLILAWISKLILDNLTLTTNNFNLHYIIFLIVLEGFITFSAKGIDHLSLYLVQELGRQVNLVTETKIYSVINNIKSLIYFEDPKFYDNIRMASNGANYGPPQAISLTMAILSSTLVFTSFIGALLWISPTVTFALILGCTPQLLISLRISRRRVDTVRAISYKERLASYLRQVLSSNLFAKEIRLYNNGNYFLNRLIKTIEDIYSFQRKQGISELRWNTSLTMFSSLTSTIAFFIVVVQATTRNITVGDIVLYLAASAAISGSILQMIAGIAQLREASMFFNYYMDLKLFNEPTNLTQYEELPSLQESIRIVNLSFRYSENHPWLFRNLNLTIPKGKCIALVGLNGAGKTTLVKLLTRLYEPNEGQIFWDDVDIAKVNIQTLRQKMRVILQDFARFDLTVKENIGLGNLAALDDIKLISLAASEARADEFICELPYGYDTVLSRWLIEGNTGYDLSGGQWQRIALARLLLKSGDFVILDEPTASLDPQAESDLFDRIHQIASESTALLISHRFSTVRAADVIAVLQNGTIVEYGSHTDLIHINGIYANLYRLQSKNYELV